MCRITFSSDCRSSKSSRLASAADHFNDIIIASHITIHAYIVYNYNFDFLVKL